MSINDSDRKVNKDTYVLKLLVVLEEITSPGNTCGAYAKQRSKNKLLPSVLMIDLTFTGLCIY